MKKQTIIIPFRITKVKYYIVKLDTSGTNDVTSFPLPSDPSKYTEEELRNNKDGIWQCGESVNPGVFGNDFVCGSQCDGGVGRRRKRDIEGNISIF